MEQLTRMLNLQFQLFLLMGVGIVVTKLGYINKQNRPGLNNLFMNLLLPANIINAFRGEFTREMFEKGMQIILIITGCMIFGLVLGQVLYRNVPDEQRKVLKYGTLASNAGFLGNPIVEGVYGAEGLFYAAIALIPIRFFIYSIGVSFFTTTDRKSVVKKIVTHPCIVAVYIGLIRMIGHVQFPGFVDKSIASLSSCMMPFSMLLIGAILSEIHLNTLFDKQVLFYCALRLIIMPAAVLVVLKLFHVDPLLTGVAVLLTGMPMATLTGIFASQYGGDEMLASRGIFLTTLFSLVTLPIWCLLV